MLIALMDEARRVRLCEVEDDIEARFILVREGFEYFFERREDQPDGMRTYYLVDAEKVDGLGSTL